MTRSMNFSSGPAALPLPALERARDELLDYQGTGSSLMEQSHRDAPYDAVHREAMALLRELYGIPATHDIFFLTGGASQQFAQIPLNFLGAGKSADHVVTGTWSEKAFEEAKRAAAFAGGAVRLAFDTGAGTGESRTWTRVPRAEELSLDPNAAYVHLTTNETIHGVQFAVEPGASLPDTGSAPLIADMSSDFLWKPMDLSRFAFVYAGAQKNLGPSGVVVVIADKEFLARGRRDLPKFLQYRTHSENESLYNTPPTFAIYLVRNVLQWLKGIGGLPAIEQINREKARLVYAAIDGSNGFYRCPVEQASRSVMNVVFRLPTEELEKRFVSEAKARRMSGLKGHRSVGGIRASLYNAAPVEWASGLAAFMADFARANG